MTELLCIKTHPEKVVVAGETYPLILERVDSCGCREVHVGIMFYPPHSSDRIYCPTCGAVRDRRPDDDYWWLRASRFAQIGTTDELEQYEKETVEVRK